MSDPILSVRHLTVEFGTREGVVRAVNDVSFDLHAGETLAVVGESGSGKSVSAMTILGLVSGSSGEVVDGEVLFDGRDLRLVSEKALRAVRGRDIAMVFQDPMTSLNPVISIGDQLAEAISTKQTSLSRSQIRGRVEELLALVGVSDVASRANQYPHQFSGGMRQRAMIAMAIANDPKILIADEPTTALDVTIQAQVLDVLRTAQRVTNSAMILITHDLGVVAEFADHVIVMYAGRVVEEGPIEDILTAPRHPYTTGLLASLPRLDREVERLATVPGLPPSAIHQPTGCVFHPRCTLSHNRDICRSETPPLVELSQTNRRSACHFSEEVGAFHQENALQISSREHNTHVVATARRSVGSSDQASAREPVGGELLRVSGLKLHFPVKSGVFARIIGSIRAVDGVDLTIRAGETLGLVGESGSGKSTTGKAILRLLAPTEGTITFKGQDITYLRRGELRSVRREMQMVFQDPFSSLNPRIKVSDIVGEPLRIHHICEGQQRRDRVSELLETVGLQPEHGTSYIHEFSGGQRQRIGIARALALNPELLILDEPVSSLDVSIQAQIINLLMDLQGELGLAYLFIAHDLAVVRQISHRVAVMYLGKIVETGTVEDVYNSATHPYTKSLLSAVPVPDAVVGRSRKRIVLTGDMPSPADPPAGCNFQTRCFMVESICRVVEPELVERSGDGHHSACHFAQSNNGLV